MISVSQPTIICIRKFGDSKRIVINSSVGVGHRVTLTNDLNNTGFDMYMNDAKTLIKELELAIEEFEVEEATWARKL